MKEGVIPVIAAVAGALVVAGVVDAIGSRQGDTEEKTAEPVAEATQKERRSKFVAAVRGTGDALVVRDIETGEDIGVDVGAPRGRRFHQVATAGDGSYVVSAYGEGQISFHDLVLSKDGLPKDLTQIPGVTLRGVSNGGSDMAVNVDGHRIAYVTYGGGTSQIEIASARPADRRKWTTASKGRISSLSWAGDILSFVWTTTRNGAERRQVRTLNATAPNGSLGASRPLLTLPEGAFAAVLSKNGGTIVAGVRGPAALTFHEFSARDGRPVQSLWKQPLDGSGDFPGLGRDSFSAPLMSRLIDELVRDTPVRVLPAKEFTDVAW
ncbi:hypothetical protein [Thermomonospora umbrina]|nr:hypothetical protein [Thermomonospora umbrina]